MNEQFVLGNFVADDPEQAYIKNNYQQFADVLVNRGGTADMLSIKKTAADKRNSGYTVVSVVNYTAFRLRLRGRFPCISIPTAFMDLIPESCHTKTVTSEPNYLRLQITEEHPLESYTELLTKIVGEALDRYPSEWSCCSRYEACSDAKTCIHPDKDFALSCSYRKKLNAGQIFFGKNRNVGE